MMMQVLVLVLNIIEPINQDPLLYLFQEKTQKSDDEINIKRLFTSLDNNDDDDDDDDDDEEVMSLEWSIVKQRVARGHLQAYSHVPDVL